LQARLLAYYSVRECRRSRTRASLRRRIQLSIQEIELYAVASRRHVSTEGGALRGGGGSKTAAYDSGAGVYDWWLACAMQRAPEMRRPRDRFLIYLRTERYTRTPWGGAKSQGYMDGSRQTTNVVQAYSRYSLRAHPSAHDRAGSVLSEQLSAGGQTRVSRLRPCDARSTLATRQSRTQADVGAVLLSGSARISAVLECLMAVRRCTLPVASKAKRRRQRLYALGAKRSKQRGDRIYIPCQTTPLWRKTQISIRRDT